MNKKIPNENVTEKELKKIIRKTNKTEEQLEIKKFIIILFSVIIIIIGVYFLTKNVVTKNNDTNTSEKEVTFDYSKLILGSLLNRPYDEYYVLVYSSKNPSANYYSNLEYSYSTKEDAIKIYTADLNDEMNAKFYNKDGSNPNAKTIEDLQLGDLTLIKVKNKEIVKYIEDIDSIKSELGL